MKKKKYLVTGGTGFIGSAIVKRLLKENQSVRVLDNNFRGTCERLQGLEEKIEIINADIRDAEVVYQALKDIDSVIHLAFINGTEFFYKMPELVLDVGIKGMINVIEGEMNSKNYKKLKCYYLDKSLGSMFDSIFYTKNNWDISNKKIFFSIKDEVKSINEKIKSKEQKKSTHKKKRQIKKQNNTKKNK